ncbi:MAG: hypothetical protein B2I18_05745 [Cuniculiplasma sp. C_DKE]|jgi:alpha-mannosidase|uniref:Alpha-mannosidase n=1 Tax=Cuniculiplasma divulgatum TaxID=1673428 RepID=A0A1R4A619_9ARCH|nr:glycoside hydrolase family 38 C-terminal domain-containing protein [Cuniculiplasma divulgatum]MCI2412486.1 alpha-mannosidase [Cuniculiplasma sp.]OWP54730.1 MAG: hypothetical protein B2I18_05745 [Cuniculiplasma sp. C_DKE]WMT48753.1 MAG: glycoside hydrolase family 38 C-terminal domain-containing protein [Thermoplasmatales archaeon]SJK84415.1 alpha-mannosidase [Cuniculiplasma divulgatum]
MKPDIKRKALRRVQDIISMCFNYVILINQIKINGENQMLPFSKKSTPDEEISIKLQPELQPLNEGQKYLIALDMSGIGIAKFDGNKIQTIDPGHRYISFDKAPKSIEIVATSTSLFGSNMWSFRINRIIFATVDWKKFSAALRIESIIKSALARDDETLISGFLESLYKVKATPNIMQLTVSDIIDHKNEGSYEELVDFYSVPVNDGKLADLPYGNFSISPLEEILHNSGIKIQHNIYPMGHCHIDAAWLWPYSETKKKTERSFLNVTRLFDDGYKFVFAQSSALFYKWAKEKNSKLFSRIKELAGEGKWLPVGGMWVESDTNLLIGESLARQFLYGQNYFKANFNSDAKIGWLPDTFGFSGQLPQIMRQSGIESFITHKLRWNDTNVFPHTFFNWCGIDGTVIPTILVNSTYNGNMQFDEINRVLSNVNNFDDPYVYQFGYGDGGGGPNSEMLELLDFLPEVAKNAKPEFKQEEFLKDVMNNSKNAPEVNGELYVETHRGVYTTNYGIKRRVALLEDRLIACDFIKSVLNSHNISHQHNDLSEEWETLLTAQFHDVLPGSANYYAYDEAFSDLDRAIRNTESFINESIKAYCKEMKIPFGNMIVNTSQYNINSSIDLRRNTIYISEKSGKEESSQNVSLSVPSFTLNLNDKPLSVNSNSQNDFEIKNDKNSVFIKGKYYSFIVDDNCNITVERDLGIIFSGHLALLEDVPGRFDAWNIDLDTLNPGNLLSEKTKSMDFKQDGVNTIVSVKIHYEDDSIIEQRFIMNPNNSFIEVRNRINLRNREKLVKFFINSKIKSKTLKCEIPFGMVERDFSDDKNKAKFEFPALRFVNWSDQSKGFSIVARELHGYSFVNDTLGISLLKAPLYPNPFSDGKETEVTFFILPEKDYKKVYRELNFVFHPPIVIDHAGETNMKYNDQLLKVTEDDIIIENIKETENGKGVLLRSYALENGGKLDISSKHKFGLEESNMLEDKRGKVNDSIEYGKYQIRNIILNFEK